MPFKFIPPPNVQQGRFAAAPGPPGVIPLPPSLPYTFRPWNLPGFLGGWESIAVTPVADGQPVSSIPGRGTVGTLTASGADRATYLATGGPGGLPALRFNGAQRYALPVEFILNSRATTVYQLRRRRGRTGYPWRAGSAATFDAFDDLSFQDLYTGEVLFNGVQSYRPYATGDAPGGYVLTSWVCGASSCSQRQSAMDANYPTATVAGSALVATTTDGAGYVGSSFSGNCDLGDIVCQWWYGEAHDDETRTAAEAQFTARYRLPVSLSAGPALIGVGNSFMNAAMDPAGDGGLLFRAATALGWPCINFGQDGATTAGLASGVALDADLYAGANRVGVYFELVNDFSGGALTGAQAYAGAKAFCEARLLAGFPAMIAYDSPSQQPYFPDHSIQVAANNCNTLLAADFSVATPDAAVWLPGPGVTYADALVKSSTLSLPTGDTLHPTSQASLGAKLALAVQYAGLG